MLEILLPYRQLFVQGNVFIGEWGIFGADIFLHYSRVFGKCDFVIGGVECTFILNSCYRLYTGWQGNVLALFAVNQCY